jgi:hypothetical protein
VIAFVAAKGIVTFHELARGHLVAAGSTPGLGPDDASFYFPSRVMNLGALYPYLPPSLCRVLRRYTLGSGFAGCYRSLDELLDDLATVTAELPPGTSTLHAAR